MQKAQIFDYSHRERNGGMSVLAQELSWVGDGHMSDGHMSDGHSIFESARVTQ
jgi:hypothetical protein